jgi:alkylation response protein AidB-like acyl-CoA dehydrogenase
VITSISVFDPVARDFADSVAGVAARHATHDPWRPGSVVSDANPELLARLEALGWTEVAVNEELTEVAGPAAFELGRTLAPLDTIDVLLGGALCVGGLRLTLSRYAHEGATLAAVIPGAILLSRADELEPVAYGDAIGAARVNGQSELGEADSPATRRDAWVAANVGYLAGVLAYGLDLTHAHTEARVAFGRPLAALDTVQQALAEVATAADGLRLLSLGRSDDAALAWAAVAAAEGLAACQQLTGAIGFTLEYPLQRALRRARSMRSWIETIVYAEL